MPDPLAMPSRRTRFLPARNSVEATFGLLSVVIMAQANCVTPCAFGLSWAISLGSLARIFSARSGTPIMPVEDGNICSVATFNN